MAIESTYVDAGRVVQVARSLGVVMLRADTGKWGYEFGQYTSAAIYDNELACAAGALVMVGDMIHNLTRALALHTLRGDRL